ncbi:organellar and viral DNA polymerase type B, partial [Trichomonas vaginalis G3]
MYKKLSRLDHEEIKKLLKNADIEVSKRYATNKSSLAKYLNDYRGVVTYEKINDYINNKTFPLNDVQVNLYHKQAVPKEVRKEMYDITNVSVGETRKKKSDEEKKNIAVKYAKAIAQLRKANEVIKSIDDKALDDEKWLKKDENNKRKNVKAGNRIIDFNIRELNEENRNYLHERFGKMFIRLLQKIKVNSQQKWMICYKLDGKFTNSTLNIENIGALLHQLKQENFITEIEANAAGIIEKHYDFFMTNIKNLEEIKMYDLTEYEGLTMSDIKKGKPQKREKRDESKLTARQQRLLNRLKEIGDKQDIDDFWNEILDEKRTNKKRSGEFWKYLCRLPINLERYQIFNELNKRTAKLMTEDNCFVYACIQAGVDEQTVDHMREVIRVRDFPQSKIQEISNATGIAFNVTIGYFNDSRHNEIKRYIPKECETVRTIDLLLVEDHYMLNERLPMTTYFIINYNEILKSLGGWNIERQMKIYKKRENRFVIDSTRTTPLWDILKTLRECNYFEPLSYGELFTYTTDLYKQKLAPFKDLNYTPNYCVQLKKKSESKDSDKSKQKFIPEHIFFADFECSTDGVHKAFNICYDSEDGKISESIWGQNCATKFLERIPDKSLIYFHNLSYDINFILRHL